MAGGGGGDDEIVAGAWDSKGDPAVRSRTGGWGSAIMIIVVELCERMTTLGIAVNLVTYLTGTMHIGNAQAANDVTNFLGSSFMFCFLGGIVADAFFGRYRNIAIGAAIQATGVTILTISTVVKALQPPGCAKPPTGPGCLPATGVQQGVLFLALYMTALGTGGLKSSVSGFGSDQFDDKDPGEKKKMTAFFGWFFFAINIGALFSVTVLVYIQEYVARDVGYGIIAGSIAVGLIIFLSGTGKYRYKKLTGSPLTQIAAVVVAAWRKRGLQMPTDTSLLYETDAAAAAGDYDYESKIAGEENKQKLTHTDQFRFLDRAAIVDGTKVVDGEQNKWRLSTVTDVEEVKMVVMMIPIWATTIIFWTVYAQMTTFSVSQADTMDRRMGGSFRIPAGSVTAFFVASILLVVPINDRLILPFCRRFTGHPQGLSPLQSISVGLVLSIVAMVAAAPTEHMRLKAVHTDPSAPPSVFRLMPQFFFVGAGETFTYVGQLDFFLGECPKGMKSMSTGLFLTSISLGCFFSTLLVSIVHAVTGGNGKPGWLADDINDSKLYNFYWLLAVLSAINLVLFIVAARWFSNRKKLRPADKNLMAPEENISMG